MSNGALGPVLYVNFVENLHLMRCETEPAFAEMTSETGAGAPERAVG